MGIKGFQGTSLLDFPGRVASLVFTGGCNLTCAYCHNPDLVINTGKYPDAPMDDVLAEIGRRAKFIDGVVVSGGEPTIYPHLLDFLAGIKGFGLDVKLDTNGLRPDVLAEGFDRNLIDYVAMDFKTSPSRYGELHSGPVSVSALKKSVEMIMTRSPEYEFRTTMVPDLVGATEVEEIVQTIDGAKKWVLQQFVAELAMTEAATKVKPYTAEQLKQFADSAKSRIENVEIRGI